MNQKDVFDFDEILMFCSMLKGVQVSVVEPYVLQFLPVSDKNEFLAKM
jgi:hypothetical protein